MNNLETLEAIISDCKYVESELHSLQRKATDMGVEISMPSIYEALGRIEGRSEEALKITKFFEGRKGSLNRQNYFSKIH